VFDIYGKIQEFMSTPDNYYTHARTDLLPFLEPIAGKTVLDVGCGAGELGKRLKELGCGAVYGVEYAEEPAQKASQHYDKVFMTPIEQVDLTPFTGFFDYVICADVIEHLADPWDVLSKLRATLKDTGAVVASIPNVRHRFVIADLLKGSFDYRGAGILDKTHLRFFTFDSIVHLFKECGLIIDQIEPNNTTDAEKFIPIWKKSQIPELMQKLILFFSGMEYHFRDDELVDFFTVQYLLRAHKASCKAL
jgi:2-polyprenyl-3-methyl-5-hydroxy-6-metoxy-1,4-benzoquinol methylase